MARVNWKWAALFGAQIAIGGALLWFPPAGVEDAATWGWTLLSMALGQGVSAGMKATND